MALQYITSLLHVHQVFETLRLLVLDTGVHKEPLEILRHFHHLSCLRNPQPTLLSGDNGVDNQTILAVNEAIASHPVEALAWPSWESVGDGSAVAARWLEENWEVTWPPWRRLLWVNKLGCKPRRNLLWTGCWLGHRVWTNVLLRIWWFPNWKCWCWNGHPAVIVTSIFWSSNVATVKASPGWPTPKLHSQYGQPCWLVVRSLRFTVFLSLSLTQLSVFHLDL